MTTIILISSLILIDVVLLFLFLRSNKRANLPSLELRDITEERRYITELRNAIQEDLEHVQAQSKEVLKKVATMAAEAELEVKSGSDAIAKDLENIVADLTKRFESPINELSAKQGAIERLMQKMEREKQALVRLIERSEQICAFFNEKIPYQTILEELQDKKYRDARQMLAKGYKSSEIAKELGMTRAEVELIAEIV